MSSYTRANPGGPQYGGDEERHLGGDGGVHHHVTGCKCGRHFDNDGIPRSTGYVDNDGISRAMTPAEHVIELQRQLDEAEFGAS